MLPSMRSYEPTDDALLVSLRAELSPERASPWLQRWRDATDEAAGRQVHRVVVEREGRIAAFAEIREPSFFPKPGQWVASVVVDPAHRRQGIGRELLNWCVAGVRARNGIQVSVSAPRNAAADGLLARAGFERRGNRTVEVLAPVVARDPEGARRSLEGLGLSVDVLQDLQFTVRDWADQLYALSMELEGDVPEDRGEAQSLAAFLRDELGDPGFRPDALWVVRDGQSWIAMTELRDSALPHAMRQELTGVVSAYRRRGIGGALKRVSLGWAANHGIEQVVTSCDEGNRPMRSLNAKLGFQVRRRWGGWRHIVE